MLKLVPLDPSHPEVVLADGASETVGRSGDATVCVRDPRVGRVHARVRAHVNRATVEDLESPSGTFVNGARVRGVTEVSLGDEVRFGGVSFRLARALDEAPKARPHALREATSGGHDRFDVSTAGQGLGTLGKVGPEAQAARDDELSRQLPAKLLGLFFETATDHGFPLPLPLDLRVVRPGLRATPGILERWPDGLPGEIGFGPAEVLALHRPDLPDYVVAGAWGYGITGSAYWWIEKRGRHSLLFRWPRDESLVPAVEFLRTFGEFHSRHVTKITASDVVCNMGLHSAAVVLAHGRELSAGPTSDGRELFARLEADLRVAQPDAGSEKG